MPVVTLNFSNSQKMQILWFIYLRIFYNRCARCLYVLCSRLMVRILVYYWLAVCVCGAGV